MRKRILIGACTAFVLAACAHTPPATSDLAAAPVAPPRADCLTTGTRIPLGEGECAMQPGRAYSGEELKRTGAMTTLEALRMLDPAISR